MTGTPKEENMLASTLQAIKKQLPGYAILPHETCVLQEGRSVLSVSYKPDNRAIILLDRGSLSLKSIITQCFSSSLYFDDLSVLNFIVSFVNKKFSIKDNLKTIALEKQWLGDDRHQIELNGKKVAVIPLDYFVQHQTGVCRHLALLTAYIVDSFIQNKFLNGRSYYFRVETKVGIPHATIVFINAQNQLFYVDATKDSVIETSHQQLLAGYKKLSKVCGCETIKAVIDKYDPISSNDNASSAEELESTQSYDGLSF